MSVIHGANYGTPTLDLNFAKNKSLIDTVTGRNLVTFSRAQANYLTTYVGADGLIKYASADEPRFDHNPLTGECLGLLIEEQRTNILTNSQVYSSTGWTRSSVNVTTNSIIAPDGTLTGSLITANGIGSEPNKASLLVSQSDVSSSIYTASCFVKRGTFGNRISFLYNTPPYDGFNGTQTYIFNFDSPSGNYIAYPNGWYRIWFTTTTARTSINSFQVNPGTVNDVITGDNFYLWGYQVEAGTFPTSYIPTSGSTVTRSADTASITGTNFSRWYNQTEGTVFVNFNTPAKSFSSALQVYSIRNSAPTDFIEFYTGNTGGVSAVTLDVPAGRQFAFYGRSDIDNGKYALALKQNDFAISKNGISPLTDTNGLMTTSVDRMLVGGSSSSPLNGTINRLTYYPTRLQNFQLQQLTK